MPSPVPLLRRPTFLRALSIALAAVFALPSCMTMQLWSNDDQWREEGLADPRALTARLETGEQAEVRCILELPESAAARLHGLLPEIPGTARLVRIVPRGSHDELESVAVLLALQAAGHPLGLGCLRLSTEPGEPTRASLHWQCFGLSREGSWLPAARWKPWLFFKNQFIDVTCTIEPLAALPPHVGQPFDRFGIEEYARTADGMHTLTKLALTPLSLAGDVLFSPAELLFFLFP